MLTTVTTRYTWACAAALILISAHLTPAISQEGKPKSWGNFRGNEVVVGRQGTTPGGKPTEPASPGGSGATESGGSQRAAVVDDPYEYYAHYGCPLPGTAAEADDYCSLNQACTIDGEDKGVVHYVYRRLKSGGEWERTGSQYCAAPGSQSPEDAAQRVTAPPTPTVTAEDLQKMPIQPGTVSIQPGPNTLKNYHTNIYVDSRPQELEVTLLGQPVRVRATPVSYTFDYGDGTTTGPTTDPGRALPENSWDTPTSTSHQYRETGDYAIVISTEFRGEYRVGDGEWQPVEGTATLPSQPQTVSVWRTKSGWVKDGCSANPRAWGC